MCHWNPRIGKRDVVKKKVGGEGRKWLKYDKKI